MSEQLIGLLRMNDSEVPEDAPTCPRSYNRGFDHAFAAGKIQGVKDARRDDVQRAIEDTGDKMSYNDGRLRGLIEGFVMGVIMSAAAGFVGFLGGFIRGWWVS